MTTISPRSCTGTRPGPTLAKIRAFAFVAVGLSVSGCVVGPDYRTPIMVVPAHWSDTTRARAAKPAELSRWWERLRDPTLNALIDEAVAGNLDVAAAKAKIREARASYRETAGTLFPSADGSASATRGKGSSSSSSSSGSSSGEYSLYEAGFDASWELDLFGANRRSVEAARYGVDAANEDLRNTLLTLIGDVASNYVETRGYQTRIALARRTAASQRQTAALTRTKFEAGSASAVDVANAEGLAASTEADIPALEASYTQAVHALSVLTGQSPNALADRLKKTAPIPTPRLPIPTGIPADILLTRPDVRLAERQLAQYTAKVGQAEAARYPSVSLTGSISTSGTKIGDLGKSSSISWSFGPTLTVPIFNGGQLKAAADVARAQRDQYFIAYRAAVLTALQDVEDSIVALSQERRKNQKLSQSAGSYRQAANLSRTLYRAGSSSFLDVLDAERSLYSAETSLIESRVAIATDYVALNKALGGGWDGAVDASRPEVVDVATGPHLPRSGN